MLDFLIQLKLRNEALFYFGSLCLVASLIFLVMTKASDTQVFNVNAWYKPFKFAFSTFLFAWAMAWYCHYLPAFEVRFFNATVILLLGFEILYIAVMASKGQLSHYNISSSFYAAMYSLMAFAATAVTLYTAYIGWLFFVHSFPEQPAYYIWGIRMGILIFVIFSFEGFLMGSRMSHTVGAVNDNSDWWIVGWSKKVGDLRVAHFIGMHALQFLPILAYYLLKDTKITLLAALLYGLLAIFTLVQALQGRPLMGKI